MLEEVQQQQIRLSFQREKWEDYKVFRIHERRRGPTYKCVEKWELQQSPECDHTLILHYYQTECWVLLHSHILRLKILQSDPFLAFHRAETTSAASGRTLMACGTAEAHINPTSASEHTLERGNEPPTFHYHLTLPLKSWLTGKMLLINETLLSIWH